LGSWKNRTSTPTHISAGGDPRPPPGEHRFILPIQAILARTSLLFCFKDDPKGGLYVAYREAWHVMRL
jgi:hypothetical protein